MSGPCLVVFVLEAKQKEQYKQQQQQNSDNKSYVEKPQITKCHLKLYLVQCTLGCPGKYEILRKKLQSLSAQLELIQFI